MTKEGLKVLGTFAAGGLASALLTQLLSYVPTEAAVAAIGPVFVGGLGLSTAVSYRRGWLRARISLSRICASAFLVFIAFPAAILGLVIGPICINALLPGLDLRSDLALTVGTYLGAVVAAAVLSTALRVFTGAWDLKVLALLIACAVATIPLSAAIEWLVSPHFRDSFAIAFLLGEGSFATLSGYWLLRSEQRTASLMADNHLQSEFI